MQDIARESNCRIAVNFDPDSDGIDPAEPITISVMTWQPSSALENLRGAREKIQELLLNYLGLRDVGAKGRLIYEVASSCRGDHIIEGSTSGAVHTNNPYSGNCRVMSLV